MNDYRQQVASRFGSAAHSYDAHSHVQRHTAQQLTQLIAAAALPPRPRVLELGCGTGHLTARLLTHLPGAQILATDIAPEMVAACHTRCGDSPRIDFAVMDACRPHASGGSGWSRPASVDFYDLICANLAAQWFDDLPATVRRLMQQLKPGGLLALSLLGADTFREWRAAHAQQGLMAGSLRFPTLTECHAAFTGERITLTREIWVEQSPSPMEFLRGLRAIGADTPTAGHAPLSAGNLRRVMRSLGPTLTYELIYARLVRL